MRRGAGAGAGAGGGAGASDALDFAAVCAWVILLVGIDFGDYMWVEEIGGTKNQVDGYSPANEQTVLTVQDLMVSERCMCYG